MKKDARASPGRMFALQRDRCGEFELLEGSLELRFFSIGDGGELGENTAFEIYEGMVSFGALAYNWDSVPFSVNFTQHDGVECISFCLNVEQNYLDEWFAIFLGIRITEKLNNIALGVVGESGDSILVHLADRLPGWLKPCNSRNRCFAMDGRIHLIDAKGDKDSLGMDSRNDGRFGDISLRSALEELKRIRLRKERFAVGGFNVDDEYTNLFMKKYDLINKINEKEKRHNFYVILPAKVAEMVLKFHYLISLSLKYIFEYADDFSRGELLKREDDSGGELSTLFHPRDLVRVRICMTRPQYSRLFNEGMAIKLPTLFSKKSWMSSVPPSYLDDIRRTEREVHFGRLVSFGLYMAYTANPERSLSVFSWIYLRNDYWSLLDDRPKSEFLEFLSKSGFFAIHKKKEHFRDLWRDFSLFNSENDQVLTRLLSGSGNNTSPSKEDSSMEWLNNDEYAKNIVEQVQLAYSYGSERKSKSSGNKESERGRAFCDLLARDSHYEGIESDTSSEEQHAGKYCSDFRLKGIDSDSESQELTDYSLDASLDDNELAELEESMRLMDEELRRTLKTTVPALELKEGREFAQEAYKDSLEMEKAFGIIGPATTLGMQ